MVFEPTGRTDVEIDATPDAFTVPDPSDVAPLANWTDPVTPAGRVAVSVTDCPKVLGPEVVRVSVGDFLFTVCVNESEEAL